MTPLKLDLAQTQGLNQINAYGPDYVVVNGVKHHASLVVTPDEFLPRWPVAALDALAPAHIAALLAHRPEVVLIGTGATLRFPPAPVLRPLIDANVGYEVMATAAACRTFSVLVAEGRRVVAGLIVA